jgi:hypothetical protein
MPRPVPCLGYPSRSAAAVALQGKGLVLSEIGRRIGVDAKTASALIASAKRTSRPQAAIAFDSATLNLLRTHAAFRRCQPQDLARRIVETAVKANLVNAILDDRKVQS